MPAPKVEVRQEPHTTRLVAWCLEAGCKWLYSNTVVSDVQYRAKLHRGEHREGRA